jgi:hypothetical protein
MRLDLPRRMVLKAFVFGLGALGFAGCLGILFRRTVDTWPFERPRTPGGAAAPALARQLVGVLVHKDSADVVGRAYLAERPAEADSLILFDLICGAEPEARPDLARTDRQALGQWLGRRQREDFDRGRIVKVNGWILSETEARLCALAALV